MIEVVIPDVGEGGMDIVFSGWLVAEGQWVEAGDNLFELDTAKANLSVQAFASGRVEDFRVQEGDEVEKGQVVAVLTDGAIVGGVTSTPMHELPTSGLPGKDGPTASSATPTPRTDESRARSARVSPKEKFLANRAQESSRDAVALPARSSARPSVGAYRRATAAAAIASWVQTPHVSATAKSSRGWEFAQLIAALSRMLTAHPELCVRWDGIQVIQREDHAIGILWATQGGLVQTCVTAHEAISDPAGAIESARGRAESGVLRPVDHLARFINVQWIEAKSLESVSAVLPSGDSLMLCAVHSPERTLLSLVGDQRCIDLHSLAAVLDEVCETGEITG